MKQRYDGSFWVDMNDLIGKTITSVVKSDDDCSLSMHCDEGVFTFYHEQACCESVYIEDVVGDLDDLVGSPILIAEESTSDERPADLPMPDYEEESQTWTFYKLATIKGYVDIRWFGSSNGYYSESVDIKFEPKEKA